MNLFKFFSKKPERAVLDDEILAVGAKIGRGAQVVVGSQLQLAGASIEQATRDLWVAGYVWGAHCALLQHHGLGIDDRSVMLLQLSYASLYPSPESGVSALQFVLRSENLSNHVFVQGIERGTDDTETWLASGSPTMELAIHLHGGAR